MSDARFAEVEVPGLAAVDRAAGEDERVFHLFLADTAALADPSYPLLAVDLADDPGRTFRVPVRWFADVSANLSIANMDFAEFADAADDDGGTFRGFRDA
ncbi:hypothetical protein [Streptomyces sp. NPDC051921]|uniref:DUF6924 domain-containing protein n=1 Tax=Streptomyces sp. NPDC051921 TaxID=3155806 RepID=UPI0034286003